MVSQYLLLYNSDDMMNSSRRNMTTPDPAAHLRAQFGPQARIIADLRSFIDASPHKGWKSGSPAEP
jgi:hypothetical protein